jgi:hypothetical protein
MPGNEQLAAARSANEFALRSIVDFRAAADATADFKERAGSASQIEGNALKMLQACLRDAKSVGAALDKLGAMIAELTAHPRRLRPLQHQRSRRAATPAGNDRTGAAAGKQGNRHHPPRRHAVADLAPHLWSRRSLHDDLRRQRGQDHQPRPHSARPDLRPAEGCAAECRGDCTASGCPAITSIAEVPRRAAGIGYDSRPLSFPVVPILLYCSGRHPIWRWRRSHSAAERFQHVDPFRLCRHHRDTARALCGPETCMANGKTVSDSNLLQTLLNLWPYMWPTGRPT